MGREIKFRAWNTANKTMHEFINAKPNWSFSFLNQAVFIWLQFTGLKDKNGMEIYEGDIVAVPEYYETPEMTATRYINWEVVFVHGAWHLQRPGMTLDGDESNMFQEHFLYDENFEVMGNIHQHPELLQP